ncbi:hypothetical protein IDG59_14760, partial [Staphylococcus sp. EG-SA-1]|nr:hypothetical protein [Staphylococcus sp. EG-SA-1]
MNETPKMIKATGGFAKSEVWRQMMSDIFDTELVVPESYESSCYQWLLSQHQHFQLHLKLREL